MNRKRTFAYALVLVACLPPSWVRAGSPAPVVVYSDATLTTPQASIASGSTWSSMGNLPSIGGRAYWSVLRSCPTRNELAFVGLDNEQDINACFYNGSSWSAVTELTTTAGSNTTRPFDQGYEKVSGDLLIVYSKSTYASLAWRTYNGTTLSSESTLSLPSGTGAARFVQLIPRPGSDEMLLLALDTASRVTACFWNGSSFGSPTTLSTSALGTTIECMAGAYETLSGHALVVYGNTGDNVYYRTWNGSSWSSALNAPNQYDGLRYARLVSDPASNSIILARIDSYVNLLLNVWSGSSWNTTANVEDCIAYSDRRCFDVAYEPVGSKAIVAYGQCSAAGMRYRTWDGSGWSSEHKITGMSYTPQVIALTPGASGSTVYAAISNANPDLSIATWSGSFGTLQTVKTSMAGTSAYEQFMVAMSTKSSVKVIKWREVPNPDAP